MRKCAICGKLFVGKTNAKYCSAECRKKARRTGTIKRIEIGDKFDNWTVIGKSETKSHNSQYIVQCKCGNKKIYRRDVLLERKYGKCNVCKSQTQIKDKKDLIKKKWNEMLNDELHLEELSIDRRYYFNCEKGHTYLSTIWQLSENCPVCEALKVKAKKVVDMDLVFDDFIEGMDLFINRFDKKFISADTKNWILYLRIEQFGIICRPKQHNTFDEVIHGTKLDFMDIHSQMNFFRRECHEDPMIEKIIEIEIDLEQDYRYNRSKLVSVLMAIDKKEYEYLDNIK